MNFLIEITVLLFAAALAAPLGRYWRVGSVLAFFGAGVLVGPWALALFNDPQDILHFADQTELPLLPMSRVPPAVSERLWPTSEE